MLLVLGGTVLAGAHAHEASMARRNTAPPPADERPGRSRLPVQEPEEAETRRPGPSAGAG